MGIFISRNLTLPFFDNIKFKSFKYSKNYKDPKNVGNEQNRTFIQDPKY